jgi:cytochrome bd-type quinol oxidase subunit 1
MVKVILRSLVFRNPTQVQLIRESSRYEQISPEEVINKFVSFECMVKEYKHIVNLEKGAASTLEEQPIAFKATEEKKEEPTPTKTLPIDASKIDNEEMALTIKSIQKILKPRKGKEYKPRSKKVATYKKNGPRAIWLKRFWCLMINITCGLMCLLVFMFVVHMMRKRLGLRC